MPYTLAIQGYTNIPLIKSIGEFFDFLTYKLNIYNRLRILVYKEEHLPCPLHYFCNE